MPCKHWRDVTKAHPGDCVTWWRAVPGGQGVTQAVPARVVRVTEKRVIIQTARARGGVKRVAVHHANVRWALGASPR
jgi:hypothetical protein